MKAIMAESVLSREDYGVGGASRIVLFPDATFQSGVGCRWAGLT